MHTTTASKCLAHSASESKEQHVAQKKISNLNKSSENIPLVHERVKKNSCLYQIIFHPPRHPQKSNGSLFKASPLSLLFLYIVYCFWALSTLLTSVLLSLLAIQGVTLNASLLLLNVSDKFSISCTVIGGPDDLTITWLKAGQEIGLSHRTKVETQVRRSQLSVRDVMAEDEGTYICQAKYANR